MRALAFFFNFLYSLGWSADRLLRLWQSQLRPSLLMHSVRLQHVARCLCCDADVMLVMLVAMTILLKKKRESNSSFDVVVCVGVYVTQFNNLVPCCCNESGLK